MSVQNARCPALGSAVGFLQFMNWRDRIQSDPQILQGKPCVKGTRLTVRRVLALLALYPDRAELRHEYPELTDERIRAVLEFASAMVADEVVALK